MPDIKIDQLEKNQLKLSFTLTQSEIHPFLEQAATQISQQANIPGFRPGKAGYEIVKQRFGEMKILEEALESIVRSFYVRALLSHRIETVGSPKIDVEKLAPANDLVFTAEVTRMPKTLELADDTKLRVEKKSVVVTDKEIDLALRDLQRMRTTEVRALQDSMVAAQDKVVVSMKIKKDGVAIEGGSSANHAIYLAEDYYIPGLKDQLIGLKEGETKIFSLPFPKDHIQKMLAGQKADIEITLKEIFHLQPPEINDALAVSLGTKDLLTLKKAIAHNIQEEKSQDELRRQEKEMLEQLTQKSRFEDIPDLLLNEEINKMIEELKRHVESQNIEFETYLLNLKRTLAQIKIDFAPQALMRIKVALVMRAVAEKENIQVEEKEINEELNRLVKDEKEKESYRNYVEQILKNRKVIERLRGIMIR